MVEMVLTPPVSGDGLTKAIVEEKMTLSRDGVDLKNLGFKEIVELLLEEINGNNIYYPEVKVCASETVPVNWLECNGDKLLRVDYPLLFSSIGTVYGSDADDNFFLPDLRGKFIRGWDNGRGVDVDRVFGSSQEDEFKSHNHNVSDQDALNTYDPYKDDGDAPAIGNYQDNDYNASNLYTGVRGGDETRPTNIAMKMIIRFK